MSTKRKLSELGASAQRRFSQNFLHSPHWITRLTQAVLDDESADEFWEVGPGMGALTEKLVQGTKPVTAFEVDRKLAQQLRTRLPALTLIEGDFLEADLKSLGAGKKIALISNLPYHLSSPILIKLLRSREKFTRLVLMFQKEVAERLCASPDTKEYGSLSVLVQLCFEIRSIGVIPPGAFFPKPGVDSEALQLFPRPEAAAIDSVERVARAAFAYRRKKLSSNLKLAFPKAPIDSFLERLRVSPLARAENLSPLTYRDLGRMVAEERL